MLVLLPQDSKEFDVASEQVNKLHHDALTCMREPGEEGGINLPI